MSHLEQKIAAQRERIPAMYGRVDFSVQPERFTTASADASTLPASQAHKRDGLLADRERVALIRAYTMLGDGVADAYAALMPEYGAKRLIGMLNDACAHGPDHVPNAPRELFAFIHEMERTPPQLDLALVEEGARKSRNSHAHVAPYVIRGAFFATFMNKYAALPMAITGTLSNETAARRIRETATFFTSSVLPGALQRHGEGFRAAAMVRLMHSMVRFNILARGDHWDTRVYGIPIPQVDQMPAGLISVYLMSREVLRRGRTSFNRDERAIVELSRYRCHLLGLPEALLSDTPQGIVDLWLTRAATLRAGFDDATCGALVRATMAADLSAGDGFAERLQTRMERSFAKMFFLKNFANDDRAEATRVGVDVTRVDDVWATATGLWLASQIFGHELALRIPGVRALTDRRLVRMLIDQLRRYGHPEYTTHAERYRPVQLAVA